MQTQFASFARGEVRRGCSHHPQFMRTGLTGPIPSAALAGCLAMIILLPGCGANLVGSGTLGSEAQVATPVFETDTDTGLLDSLVVEVSCPTEGATLYYTLDGSDPDEQDVVYHDGIFIEATTTIRVRPTDTVSRRARSPRKPTASPDMRLACLRSNRPNTAPFPPPWFPPWATCHAAWTSAPTFHRPVTRANRVPASVGRSPMPSRPTRKTQSTVGGRTARARSSAGLRL